MSEDKVEKEEIGPEEKKEDKVSTNVSSDNSEIVKEVEKTENVENSIDGVVNNITGPEDYANNWITCYDPTTGYPYYYNIQTQGSVWEKPKCLEVGNTDGVYQDYSVFNGYSYSTGAEDAYASIASFNSQNGRFCSSSGKTMWEKMGQENDREGRQLGNYFDLNSWAQNRKEYAEIKEKNKRTLNISRSGREWKRINTEKKMEKAKKMWLRDEEDDY